MVDIRQTEAVGPEYGGRLCELRDRLLKWKHCGTWSEEFLVDQGDVLKGTDEV